MEIARTRITELLDREMVPWTALPFTRPAPTVEQLVSEQGIALEEMVKAILLREQSGSRRFVMACVLGGSRVSPSAVRRALPEAEGWKRLSFASAQEIEQTTGCAPGTVAPVCLPSDLPVLFDEAIARRERINMASGHPLFGIEMAQRDLARLAGARFAAISDRTG